MKKKEQKKVLIQKGMTVGMIFLLLLVAEGCQKKDTSVTDPLDSNIKQEETQKNTDQKNEDSDTEKSDQNKKDESSSAEDNVDNEEKVDDQNLEKVAFLTYEEILSDETSIYDEDQLKKAKEVLENGTYENASNTVIKDGSFIWVMIPQDSGMQKTYYLVCRSEDAGKSWEYMQEEYAVTAGIDDICSKDGFIFLTSGSGMNWSKLEIFAENGNKKYTGYDREEILPEKYQLLAEIACAKIKKVDTKKKQIELEWYGVENQKEAFLTEKLSFSGKNIEFDSKVEDYRAYREQEEKTGYTFAKADSEVLKEEDLRKIYDQEKLIGEVSPAYSIRIAINEIYARKGYDFTGTAYENYFSQKSCHFDTLYCISCHKVGRTNIIFRSFSTAKDIDPGMFQESSDNTDDMNVFSLTFYSRNHAADSSYDHVYSDSCFRCLNQFINDPFIRQGIQFQSDISVFSLLFMADLFVDQSNYF